jgi:hypothetical protein
LLGLLNSSLTTFWLKQTSSVFRGGYLALNRQYIEGIPLIPPQPASASGRSMQQRLEELVEQMLALHAQTTGRTPQEQIAVGRQIAATDREIDRLVYDLYGLTDDAIRIVEESAATSLK